MSKADKIFTTIDVVLTLVYVVLAINANGALTLFGGLLALILIPYIIGAIYVRITKLYKKHGQKAYSKVFMRLYPFFVILVLIGTLSK